MIIQYLLFREDMIDFRRSMNLSLKLKDKQKVMYALLTFPEAARHRDKADNPLQAKTPPVCEFQVSQSWGFRVADARKGVLYYCKICTAHNRTPQPPSAQSLHSFRKIYAHKINKLGISPFAP